MLWKTEVTIGLIITLLVLGLACPEARPNWRFENFGVKEGLPQTTISAIHQDQSGYLWIGTTDGLCRYDGYEFTIYRHDPHDSTSLSNNEIPYIQPGNPLAYRTIFEDRNGHLWVHTKSGGLNRYDPCRDTFRAFRHDPENPHSITSDRSVVGAEDADGWLYLLTLGPQGIWQGFDVFDPKNEHFRHFHHQPGDTASLSTDFILSLFGDQSGGIWVGSNDGCLHRLNEDRQTLTRFWLPGPDTSKFSNTALWRSAIMRIMEYPKGTLWLGTSGSGLYRFDMTREVFTHFKPDPAESGRGPSGPFINCFSADHRGQIWIGTANHGLNRLNPETGQFTYFHHDPDDPQSLTGDRIRFVHEDDFQQIWLATYRPFQGLAVGLCLFDPQKEVFYPYLHNASDPQSPGGIDPVAFYEDRNGTLWFGMNGAGLSQFNPYREKFKRFQHDPRDANSLKDDMVIMLYDDSDYIYVGTYDHGLMRLSKKNEICELLPNPYPNSQRVYSLLATADGTNWVATLGAGLFQFDPDRLTFTSVCLRDSVSLPDQYVQTLFEDSTDTLWVGAFSGLYQYLPTENKFIHFTSNPADSTTLTHNCVKAITEDNRGNLWVGTTDGLNFFNRQSRKCTQYRYDPSNPHGISSEDIWEVFVDDAGIVWLGTWVCGLNRLDPKTGRVRIFTIKDGMPNDTVYKILPDSRGRLWISTNYGLSCFDPVTETFRNYTMADGLQNNEFNINAGYRNAGGEMYFGGISGFNVFHPDSLQDNPEPPQMVLNELMIMHQKVRAGGADAPISTTINFIDKLALTYRENVISLSFAGLHSVNPERNQYAYRLVGFDDHWTTAPAGHRLATYTNLDGGDYIFQVKAANSDGYWTLPRSLPITIHPPFWQRWWFYLGETLAILMLIAAGFWFQRHRYIHEMEFRRKTSELNFARRIQFSMLPTACIENERITISGKLITATEIGGDYYDFRAIPDENGDISQPPKRYYVVIGDATGHGAGAGLFVGMMRMSSLYALKSIKSADQLPHLVGGLNESMTQSLHYHLMGMCLGIAIIDLVASKVDFCFAGMPYPYRYRPADDSLQPIIMKGPPLGFFDKISPEAKTIDIRPDDYLVFLSDGFEERFNPERETWGEEPLETALKSACRQNLAPKRIIDHMIRACDRHARGRVNDDDMTIVVVQMK